MPGFEDSVIAALEAGQLTPEEAAFALGDPETAEAPDDDEVLSVLLDAEPSK